MVSNNQSFCIFSKALMMLLKNEIDGKFPRPDPDIENVKTVKA